MVKRLLISLLHDKNKLPIINNGIAPLPQMCRESGAWINVTSGGKNSPGTGIRAQMSGR